MLRPLQQHPNFAACLRAGGRDVIETEDGCLMLRRFAGLSVGLVSRGSAAMVNVKAPKRCLRIFNAEQPMRPLMKTRGFAPVRSEASVAEWDISETPTGLRRGMRKTWRHAVDRASDAGLKVSVTAMPADGGHWLLQAEQAQARRRRYRSLPLWLVLAWATLHPKDAVLVEARQRGVCVAGMVFLRHGDVVSYHIAQSSPDGHRLGAHRVMLWHAAVHFTQRGVVRMDLGTVDAKANEGLARFKLGTGAVARRLGGTWVSVPGLAWARAARPLAHKKAPLQ